MRMTNWFKLTVLGILGITVACSFSPQMDEEMAQTHKEVKALTQQAKVPDRKIPDDVVRVKDDIWLGDTSSVEFEGEPLPNYLEAKDGITLISNRPITLFEIGTMINKITSLSVRYAPELEEEGIKDVADSNKPVLDDIGAQWTESDKMLVNYKGPLSGLLDEVANRFGTWWKYEKNEIYFYRNITKTFVLYSLPTNPSLNVTIDVSGSGGSGDGASGNSSISQSNDLSDLDLWQQIQDTIESMINGGSSGGSGSMTVDRASGTITVTDTPSNIRRVAKYINEQNERLSKQVAISVKVYMVDMGNEDTYGFDLNKLVFNGRGSIKNISAISQTSGMKTGGGLSMGIMSKDWDIQAAIRAISTEEKGKLVTSGTVTTMNNKPAPIQVTKKGYYIKGVSTTTQSGSDNTDSSTEEEEYTTGFMMSVLPRIMAHGRLMVFFNLTLSEVVKWDDLPYNQTWSEDKQTYIGGSALHIPVIETRGFTQEVAMKSGQTLLLTGFERVKDSIGKQGTGTPDNMLLGGHNDTAKERSVFVIMLTPVVLESPLSPESRMND